jgi:hypothetical protein
MGAARAEGSPDAPSSVTTSQVLASPRPAPTDQDGPPDLLIPIALAAVAAVAGLATVVLRPGRNRRPHGRGDDRRADGDGVVDGG